MQIDTNGAWWYGIPSFLGLFTYYQDLQDTSHNTEKGKEKKQALYKLASGAINSISGQLSLPKNITAANMFLAQVAESERKKEMMMIRTFCQQTGETFPSLQKFLDNEDLIMKDPEGFYTELTRAINIARKGTEEYLTELKKIKENIEAGNRTLADYKADDYRYRLSGDLTSFMNRLTGRYTSFSGANEVLPSDFSVKVQNMVLRILEEGNITGRIAEGEDFVALAASLLVDVEKNIQQQVDKEYFSGKRANRILNEATDAILDQVEAHYKDIFKDKVMKLSPVEKLLRNFNRNKDVLDVERVIVNAKELLGITVEDFSFEKSQSTFSKMREKDAKLSDTYNAGIKQVRDQINMHKGLANKLSLVKFNISGSAQSKHGTINEFIQSILTSGRNVSGNMGVDLFHYNLQFGTEVDNGSMNTLLNQISETYTNVFDDTMGLNAKDANNLKQELQDANKKITSLISAAEKQLAKQHRTNTDKIFVYHESLKLYSSVETGRQAHAGFGGRTLNIFNYISYLYSMESNFSFPISQENMNLLGINLGPDTLGANNKEPLENYLSMYAGMVMFDDLANMSQEAVNEINKSASSAGQIIQIHLYNLNGVYVPASMMLTYISDVINGASKAIGGGVAAKATIQAPSGNKTYDSWRSGTLHGDNQRERAVNELRPEHWYAVAEDSRQNTKVSIVFLAAFQKFIEKLSKI